ncbi:MAG: hypothetical protein WDO24_21710 [Pseudomonadota bacterium]
MLVESPGRSSGQSARFISVIRSRSNSSPHSSPTSRLFLLPLMTAV